MKMSVLINSTTLNLCNSSSYLLEISCSAEQDDSFHVKTSKSNVIFENSTDSSSSLVNTLMQFVYGSKLHRVIINLQPDETASLFINSKSCLEIQYSPKIKESSNHIEGSLPISTEYQGAELTVKFTAKKGLWYDKNNNVAICGKSVPYKQEYITNVEILCGKKNIFIDEYTPSLCQLLQKRL